MVKKVKKEKSNKIKPSAKKGRKKSTSPKAKKGRKITLKTKLKKEIKTRASLIKKAQKKTKKALYKAMKKKVKTSKKAVLKTKLPIFTYIHNHIRQLFVIPLFYIRRANSKIAVRWFFFKKRAQYQNYLFMNKFMKNNTLVNKTKKNIKKKKNIFTNFSEKITNIEIIFQKPAYKKAALAFSVFFAVFFSASYWYILYDLPTPKKLKESHSPLTTMIRDRNGEVLFKIYNNANRIQLAWEDIPDIVKKSTLAIEDANFYNHHGVSFKSILRAFLHNMNQDNINLYQGGSTITQQLVKNKLVGSKKTYRRKIRELILAVWTELKYSKEEILTMYLNEVGYGGPAYGIEAASQMYFDKHVEDLGIAESALLAGLPAAPTTFSPFGANPELAIERQHQVLGRMLDLGMISHEDYDYAINTSLSYAEQKIDINAPHFVMYVKDQLVNQLGENEATEGGLDVTTTLDLNIQRKAEEIVKKQINEIGDRYNIHNAAALVTNPRTGEILAMVGSVDYFDIENKGYVNVTNMPRQPGSSIKPVNYGYAFDHGYTPYSTIVDAPVLYTAPGAESYKPVNYDGKFHGRVTLKSALANSYNIPAVKLLNSYGVSKMLEIGKKMGIRTWQDDRPIGLALTLGGLEVTMMDMARAYGVIANMGKYKDLHTVASIENSTGNDITYLFYQNSSNDGSLVNQAQAAENTQVISPLSSYWLTSILSDENARLPAFGRYSKLSVKGHQVAVKTGTSNNFRDNWTIGYTPEYLVAVWVGNNDGSFMNQRLVSGITGAAPIWNEIMTNILEDKDPVKFEKPDGLVPVKICVVNGLLTCPHCPEEKIEYFTADTVPTKACYFKSPQQCAEAVTQLEGKTEEEKKNMLWGCPGVTLTPEK